MTEYNPSKIIKDGNTYNFRDTTKIPLAGSNQISGNLIPATTDAYDLGGSSYQWNNAYIKSLTINGVACGDILTHNVSEFVNVSSDQTINGSKYFTSLLSKSNTLARGSLPTTNINEDPIFIAADKNNRRTLAFFNYYNTNGDGRVVLYAYNQNTTNYDNIGLVFGFDNTNNSKSIHPVITNACNLGTSTNKWKDVNTVLLNGKTPAYSTDIPTKVSQLTNDSGFITSEIDSMGVGWVRFKCGLQICYGDVQNNNNLGTGIMSVSFSKAFNANPKLTATPSVSLGYLCTAKVEGTSTWKLHTFAYHNNTIEHVGDGVSYNFIAVGTWK